MEKLLTISEKLDLFDKISNNNEIRELEFLFKYIEELENVIKEYKLIVKMFENVHSKTITGE